MAGLSESRMGTVGYNVSSLHTLDIKHQIAQQCNVWFNTELKNGILHCYVINPNIFSCSSWILDKIMT